MNSNSGKSPITQDLLLAKVISVNDPEGLNRIQVQLLSHAEVEQQDGTVWARIATPVAGNRKGAFLLPDVDDEVVVSFINGDSRYPVILGSLWNGRDTAPETLGGSGDRVDRWSLIGKEGTRIAIVEESPSEAKIEFQTPQGTSGELTDSSGGKVEFKTAGTTVTIDTQGVTIDTPLNVNVNATQVNISAAQLSVTAATSRFSGLIDADAIITRSISSASYTPGAGNIW